MSKKRRSDFPPESDPPEKKEKVPEFNGTEFKAMLRNPTTAMKGLKKFTLTAKKLPCSDMYDVVEGYIKISMECAEIFNLLEGEKHTETELMLIFESLQAILLRTASDLSLFALVGNAIVNKIVSTYMKLLQESFCSANHGFVRQCLNLLSAMVSQGVNAAREVLDHIQVKALFGLATRKDKWGKPDVRLAFIQFVLSFLVSGDSAVIRQILEFKELLPHILATGLKEDRVSTVNLILSTLKSRVVLNKAITKTQKVRFFTPAVLANLASLYKWDGIADATTDDDMTAEDSDSPGLSVVRGLVHSFLLDLCCSYKYGISFHDASFGTAGRAGNLILLQFVVGLKQATEDELVADLVVNVLKTSPDVLSRYFKETQFSYTPRPRSAWQDNVKFLKKIYESQPEVSTIFQNREMIPLPRLLSMIMVISVPPVCNRAFFSQSLKLNNSTVHLTAVSIMNFILKKAIKNMEYLLDKSVWSKSDVYTEDMMKDLVQQYRETLGKLLPDMTDIISTWQSLSKKEKAEDDKNKKIKSPECPEQTSKENELPVADAAEVILLKALILQVICLYQKVVPHLVMQSRFDFSKLLKGIVSEKGIREEIPPILQYQILQLALDLPASKFSWCRIQDIASSESSSGEMSVLYLLLKMFVSSSNSSFLRSSTQKLVLKVLKDTGVFEYTLSEVELWLEQLARLEPTHQETVVQFLERVLIKLVCSSHEYTDKVASFVQEAGHLQANLSSQEGDAVSIPVSHIDDVLDMLDVIMEGSDGDMEEFGPSLSEDLIVQTFPFSAMVPAALEARNKLPADKGVVCDYLSAVLSDVLHCQRDPLPLCLTLLQYDKELASSQPAASFHQSIRHLHQYYSMWLPQQCHEQLFTSSERLTKELPALSSCTLLLKAAYVQGPRALLEDTFRQNVENALASMPLAEFPVVIKQILLYIKSAVENFDTIFKDNRGAFLGILMGILQDLVVKLQNFEETLDSKPAAEKSQQESDLFLGVDESPTVEANKEQILVSALTSIFKHPCLEQWFLALELAAFPPHSLKPVALKHLCAQMTDKILTLLKMSAPALNDLSRLELLCSYMGALETATLKELKDKGSQPLKTHSRTFQSLLSFHSYMDSSFLKEVVSWLLLLPHDRLICPSSEGTQSELSIYGQVALQILTNCTSTSFQDHSRFLTQAHLHGLCSLLVSCSSPELEAFMLQTLSSDPGSAKLIHTDVLLHCLQNPLQNTLAISSLLLENCSSHRLRFEVWCLEPSNMETMSKREAFLPLINTYLQVASREDPARPKDVQTEVLKALNRTLLAKLSSSILGNLEEDSGVRLETASSLIRLSADRNDIKDLINDLPDVLQTADGLERWQLADVITEKLADCPIEQEKWRKSVTAAAFKCLIASYCLHKDHAASPSAQEQSVLRRLQDLLTSPEDVTASDWNSFTKTGLRNRYNSPHFLNALSDMLELMYGSSEIQKDLIPLSTLHMMTSSHSQFLPTILDFSEESTSCQAKEALVSLLLCLVKKCPTVCNINHFVVLLAAYGATLSTLDQKLLQLLQEYEKSKVSLLGFQSLLWGPAAVEHHKTRKSLGASLWKQSSSNDVLTLLKADMMIQTILKFPQNRRIFPQDSRELLSTNDAVKDPGSLYDPCFLLPLFSAILQPECVIDCCKFASSHALGVTVMALSSYDPNVRAAAYHVLSCFYQHLEAARFREKRQLLYLMNFVKNGIRKQNQRLPFVLTSYINKVAQLMLRPEDHMYVVLNRFLLSHQNLDMNRVPEFFKNFLGFELEHKIEREWMLNLLEEGISDGHCYELCCQQGIFQVLLGFSSSPLCSEHFQTQIIRVLCRVARVTKAAYSLTKSCALLSWMIQVVEKRNLNQQLLCGMIDLLHALWFTVLGQKEKKAREANTCSTTEIPQSLMKCVPLSLIDEFLCASLAISRHLRLGVKAAQFSLFARTLCSVLTHRETALGVNKQADCLTLRPQPLSCTEALSLLLCWASLSRCTALLTQIQALSERHKLKELMGLGRYKVRGKSRTSQADVREVNPPEDIETQEESLLADCKVHLSKIFVHWEPVFHCSHPQSDQPGDEPDPSQLAGDTALLLLKCSLRWQVENSCDENATGEFLHWLEKAVIKHGEIVNLAMLDFSFKADLLQLFHHTAEVRCHSSFPTKVETLQRFTNIMIRLLEMQGHLPDLHQPVVSACFTHHDQSRREAGLFLLSLYIHELWSGAASAERFLSHVRLVTKVESNGRKASKPSKTQTAIRAICNDIIAIKR